MSNVFKLLVVGAVGSSLLVVGAAESSLADSHGAAATGLSFLAMGDWGGTDCSDTNPCRYTEPAQVKAAAAMATVAANIGAKFALGMGDNVGLRLLLAACDPAPPAPPLAD